MTESIIVLMVYLLILFLFSIGGLVNYILTAVSLYSIADKRNIPSAWTAWLPVANFWCIGSIVDYHSKLENKKSYWRKLLITLTIVGTAGIIVSYIVLIVQAIGIADMNLYDSYMSEDEIVLMIFGKIVPTYIVFLISAVVMMTSNICLYVCYYKIFEYLVPGKEIKYFLISMLVPFGLAACLMKSRKSSLGVYQYAVPIELPTVMPVQDYNQQ